MILGSNWALKKRIGALISRYIHMTWKKGREKAMSKIISHCGNSTIFPLLIFYVKSNKMKLPSEPLKLHSKLDFTGIFSDGKITKSLHCNAFPFTYKRGLFIFGLLFGMCDLQYIFMETRRRPLMANALYVVISTHLTFFAMLDWFWPSLTHCKKAKLCNKHHLLHVNALVHFTYYLVWRCFFSKAFSRSKKYNLIIGSGNVFLIKVT